MKLISSLHPVSGPDCVSNSRELQLSQSQRAPTRWQPARRGRSQGQVSGGTRPPACGPNRQHGPERQGQRARAATGRAVRRATQSVSAEISTGLHQEPQRQRRDQKHRQSGCANQPGCHSPAIRRQQAAPPLRQASAAVRRAIVPGSDQTKSSARRRPRDNAVAHGRRVPIVAVPSAMISAAGHVRMQARVPMRQPYGRTEIMRARARRAAPGAGCGAAG